MMQKRFYSVWFALFRDALRLLIKNDPLRIAGATAFFTTFALPAILVIILQISGIFIDPRKSDLQLFEKLSRFVGGQTALQLINTLNAFKGLANTLLVTIGGFIFLIFVATTLFKVIRDSLNQIWDIPKSSGHKLSHTLSSRLRSLLVIVFAGLLFLATVLIEGFQSMVNSEFRANSVIAGLILNRTIAYLVSIVVVTTWFALIFYFLPDAKPSWKIGVTGACVTAVLFTFGKFILRWILLHSNIGNIFGTSASLVLLLLFVFYSSLIFYFGAAFTRVLATHLNKPIETYRTRTF
ncbi:MAG: YihY/virulence factor BrkB family protein [Flavitalea sp.]